MDIAGLVISIADAAAIVGTTTYLNNQIIALKNDIDNIEGIQDYKTLAKFSNSCRGIIDKQNKIEKRLNAIEHNMLNLSTTLNSLVISLKNGGVIGTILNEPDQEMEEDPDEKENFEHALQLLENN